MPRKTTRSSANKPATDKSKLRQLINTITEENEYNNLIQNRSRARSVTVGTCGGGTIEIQMRGDYHSSWMQLTPTEALEIAEQIAAASGVQVAMKPKNDFSAWRGWNADNVDYSHLQGSSPFSQPKIESASGDYPSNEERIADFLNEREKNRNDKGQYHNEKRDATSVAPHTVDADPSMMRDDTKMHEWPEDRVEEQTNKIMNGIDEVQQMKSDYFDKTDELLEESQSARDKKKQQTEE